MVKKRIYLNAFDMNTPGHQSPGLWTHPDDESYRYKDSDYWIELAKILEKGRFDAIFLADVLGTYDVYNGSRDAAVSQGAQAPVNDPSLVVPLMAAVTKHLGFGVTASVTHEHPYTFARRITTLDHLTKGRTGWNIVTSYLKSAAINMGFADQVKHDERYDIAAEYLEVVYKLWEESWEHDAVKVDKEKGIYSDPDKVHDINHDGKYFKVPGAHLSEPSPQRTPVIYQAGASAKGRAFAAKNAECVFIGAPTISATKDTVDKLHADIEKAGRSPEEVKILTMFTPIVGQTEEEANRKFNDYKNHISQEGAFALFGGWTGIDLSEYDKEENLRYVESDAIQSAVENLTKIDPDKPSTAEDIKDFVGIGGMGPYTVGSPEQVADTMESWVNEAGVDGFNIAYAVTPGTFKDFVEYVVPILQDRGLVQKEYEGTTLRDSLFSQGDQLPAHHPGKNTKGVLVT
ncbi:FMN-dependent oxidoreductase (nitrilotriacetate monooxygenase family) [Virgibacillus natechei]|uniref:FMN-dependent oxidoreductase (Nitrilotriacetate monooxygenase family) n=1 Tax=Virgibacillus natechei TaxID=1216297 RepID=A0ABS4IDY0_9BACI|nr:LLM class flavin-dependent oxidoreductase [Virgibacillus natechei]MBP1969133.1 FMN-dependent oxidoreductase (nitrilotriacetate monooxygenase family) [Virgibacillus natechei]UZD14396.1 LLM class flavin-dependent oxidoreductase [Virgibacillus natechei]